MKVFISWSGPRSRAMADALRDWIHDVIQNVECFCSTEDIRAGQRWNNEVNSWLSETDFGVLCVTPENMSAPWLNFEAGALAKRIDDDARVVPVTLGFQPAALEEPLKQFNGVPADRTGFLRLMKSIAEIAHPTMNIERHFDRWWGDLEEKIQEIPSADVQVSEPQPPDVSEMFTDIMSSIRGLTNELRHRSPAASSSSSSLSASEYRSIAGVLAENAELRENVLAGNPSALRYLRAQAKHQRDAASGSPLSLKLQAIRDAQNRDILEQALFQEAAERSRNQAPDDSGDEELDG
ncbi:toll/interleukin-1 receptor domain-containing protein [Microbacterium sp. 22296]|uniref:toll/interleukin-1 receptor domain-containing protein n=1 Tax=Microbacterium sp. 22296 TaxID=3453903 RepID=UPI003F866BFC